MQIIKPDLPFTFNYPTSDLNDSLFVRTTLYDISNPLTPMFLAHVNLTDIINGFWFGNYLAQSAHAYLTITLVYTDGTYSVIDDTRGPVCECYKTGDLDLGLGLFNFGTYGNSPDFNIQAFVYDVTTGTASLVDTIIMQHIFGGVYFGFFEGSQDHTYEIAKFIYTDDTFDTLDMDWGPGSDTMQLSSSGVVNIFQQAIMVGQSNKSILLGQSNEAILKEIQ